MITEQPVNSHDDLGKVTNSILRDAGLSIEDSGGKVTFAGTEPVRKTVMKAGASAACVKMNTHRGPWSLWAGFDINAAGIGGIYTAEATPDQTMLPQHVNVICDIMTGYLGAIEVKAALLRRATEGGSYRVLVKSIGVIALIVGVIQLIFALKARNALKQAQ